MVEDTRSVAAVYERYEILSREDSFIFHDPDKIGITSRLRALTRCQVDVDEAKRGVIHYHTSDNGTFVTVDPADSASRSSVYALADCSTGTYRFTVVMSSPRKLSFSDDLTKMQVINPTRFSEWILVY